MSTRPNLHLTTWLDAVEADRELRAMAINRFVEAQARRRRQSGVGALVFLGIVVAALCAMAWFGL